MRSWQGLIAAGVVALAAPIASIPSITSSASADEPRPLGPIYRERIRVALRDSLAPGPRARQARARFLSIVGSQHSAVAADLSRMVRDASDPQDRRAAATGLGELGRQVDTPPLQTALRTERSPVVRAAIATALGRCKGALARRSLTALVARESDEDVRLAAVAALQSTGDPAVPWALAVTLRPETTRDGQRARELLSAMGFTEPEWRVLGVATARREGTPPADAVQRWINDESPEHLPWVLWGAADPAPALIAALDHANPEIRGRAARTLWLREHARAGAKAARGDILAAEIPRMIASLTDPAPDRRGAARRRLAWAARTDLGAAAEPWRRWWAGAQAGWTPPANSPDDTATGDGAPSKGSG